MPFNTGALPLNKQSPVPCYLQLKDGLARLMREGVLQSGEKIPSENELAAWYSLSRMTVRQAVKELQSDGMVYVKRGDGTYVSSPDNTQMLIKLDGFSAEMAKLGHTVHSTIMNAERISYTSAYRKPFTRLHEPEDGSLVMFRRVRYLDETPFAIETSFLQSENGQELLARTSEPRLSIYHYIEREKKIQLTRAEHFIEPGLANKKTAQVLGVRRGSAILKIFGTTFSKNNSAIEYLEGIYRGDRYKMKLDIAR